MKRLAMAGVDQAPLAESGVCCRQSSLRLAINIHCYYLPVNIAYSSHNDPPTRSQIAIFASKPDFSLKNCHHFNLFPSRHRDVVADAHSD